MNKDWQQLLPGLLVSGVSLAVVISLIDLQELAQALRVVDLRLLLSGGLLTLSWLVVRGFVWLTLLEGRATYSQVFFTLNEGYLLNNVLPFRLGEIGRTLLLSQKASLDFWYILSSVIIERTLDLIFAVGIFLSSATLVVGVTWAQNAAFGTGSLAFLALAGLYVLARFGSQVQVRLENWGEHWTIINKFGSRRLAAFFTGLAILKRGSLFLRACGWMVFNWITAIALYYVLLKAFLPEAQLHWAIFCLGAGALGIAAPSSPGALGLYEMIQVGALSLFGVNPSTALAFAVTAHSLNYLTTGILGGYALARDGESLTGLYRRIRRIR